MSNIEYVELNGINVDNVPVKFDAASVLVNVENVIDTDPTLSVSGTPADAKATGDAIDYIYYGEQVELDATWVSGNLEDDGSIVPSNNRYTTQEYLSYGTNVRVTSSVVLVVCTYDSNHQVLTRQVKQAGSFVIGVNTIFRICAVGVSGASQAASSVTIQGKEGLMSLIEDLDSTLNAIAGTSVNAYLNSIWVPGNLEDDGSIVPFSNRYTTLEYLSYDTNVSMTPSKQIVLCTYNSNHTVLTRTAKAASETFTIPQGTIFRVCVVGSSSPSVAKESALVTFTKGLHAKQDAPEMLGSSGQFLRLDEDLEPEWVDLIDPDLTSTTKAAQAKAIGDAINDIYYGEKSGLTYTWTPGNLEDDGSIVPYDNRYTTLEYLSYNADVRVVNTVGLVVCTYNSSHQVLTREVKQAGYFNVVRNTIFRICAINVASSDLADSGVTIQEREGYITLISGLEDKIDVLAGTNTTAYLNSPWTAGNLEDDGTIVPYTRRYTTEQYMTYDTDLVLTSSKALVLCTYNSSHEVLTRSVIQASSPYTIVQGTIFRVTVTDIGSAAEAKENALAILHKDLTPKQDAPSVLGTTGQLLSLDEDLAPKWINLMEDINPIQCFETFGVIGDSISAGYTDIGGTSISSATAVTRKANWPSYMELDIGRTVTNYAQGGSATIDWRNTYKSAIEAKECYVLYLGGNDMSSSYTLGSSSDIATNFSNNSQSYYGNYDYLVRYIHSIAPNAIIFCISNTSYDSNLYATYNTACAYVAGLYTYCHYIDIVPKVSVYKEFFDLNFNGHFSPIGYNLYGKCIQKAINEYIYNNPTSFLGIPYSTDST